MADATAPITRIAISLPSSLLAEVDALVQAENRNRSEFVRAAMRMYIRAKRRRELLQSMEKGYLSLGDLNLELAAENLDEAWDLYEAFLAEGVEGQ